jgi:hypothetical protein
MPGNYSFTYFSAGSANYNFRRHLNSGSDFVTGFVNQWGDVNAAPAVVSADLGLEEASLSGVAIAPDSIIPEVIIRNRLPVHTGFTQGYSNNLVTIGSPLTGQLFGPDILFIPTGGTYWSSGNYYREGTVAPAVFSPAAEAVSQLKLIFSTGDQAAPAHSQKREPFNQSLNGSIAANDPERRHVIPAFGRQWVAITLRNTSVADENVYFRVTGLYPSFTIPAEKQIYPGAFPATICLSQNATCSFSVRLDKLFSFVTVYSQRPTQVAVSYVGSCVLYD